MTNGTRQGSIFSPKGGFGTYLDPLLQKLRLSGFGCSIGLHWYGGLAYADDVILLSATLSGLQEMVKICEKHALDYDLKFSSDPDPDKSKTICVAFNCQNRNELSNIKLNDDPLPWKISAKHIGNMLHEDGTMDADIKYKRATFINTCMNMNNEFCFIRPDQQVKLLYIYNSHFMG